MTKPLQRPKRKDPLKKTRIPLLPQGTRSRTALGLAGEVPASVRRPPS